LNYRSVFLVSASARLRRDLAGALRAKAGGVPVLSSGSTLQVQAFSVPKWG